MIEQRRQNWQEAVWLLLALTTSLFVNLWVEQQFEASKVWLVRALIPVLAVLWLVGWVHGVPTKRIVPPLRNLLLALVIVLILATFLSNSQPIALFGSLERANGVVTQLSYLLLFGCVATQIDAERCRRLLFVIVITAVPICLLGLAQALGWQPFPIYTDARTPIITTLGRANFTGAYLALLLPLTLTAARMATNSWRHVGYGALFGLQLVVIYLTQARAAWIAVIAGLGLLLWLWHAPRWSPRVRRLMGMLGGGVSLVGAVVLILLVAGASSGSIAARWTIWQASLRLLWPRLWLGYGADTLELYFPAVYPPQLVYYQGRGVVVDRAHNWLLDGSLSYGLVAMVVFVLLVAFILHAGWQRLSLSVPAAPDMTMLDSDQPLENRWLAGCVSAIFAHLVGNFFLFEVAATAVVFWLLLAIITSATLTGTKHPEPIPFPRKWRNVLLIWAIVVASGLVWLGTVRPLLADIHSWRGTQALNRGNLPLALAEYETAVRYQPRRAPYRLAVGLTAAQLKQFDQAEYELYEAIALQPTDPLLYRQLAIVYAYEATETAVPQKITLAYTAYEQAQALAPTIGLTAQQYADLALRAGDIDLARQQAQRAVNLDATDGLAFGILGWAHLQTGNLSAAQAAFEQALTWQPNSADFHLGLATVYSQQGQFADAYQAVQQSLRLDPTYPPALALQAQLSE